MFITKYLPDLRSDISALLVAGACLAGIGCGLEDTTEQGEVFGELKGAPQSEARQLFEQETFGGNGRTCRTCHSRDTGTVSPADAQARFAAYPRDPLFIHDGSDDGLGNGVSRMLARATIRIEIPLPANVHIQENPTAERVVLLRGVPTTLNTPALDPVLMLDGRAASLPEQALGAIADHAQATVSPTAAQLDAIAQFQRTAEFFSSPKLFAFSRGGPAPKLPMGRSPSERRGRRFFEDRPLAVNASGTAFTLDGACAHCHSGPMLDTANAFGPFPPGARFTTAAVSEVNKLGNPVFTFVFENPDGTTTSVVSPDPGRALVTGNPADANLFKTPSLRGLNRTAPYFHDNSALTLDEVVDQYVIFFAGAPTPLPFEPITPQDRGDIIAFLRLLSQD